MATTIPMMRLRSQPGTYIDRVYYRKESFIVEKTGTPRAVLVPMSLYNEIKRVKQTAKKKFFNVVDRVQERTAKYNSGELQSAIDEAVAAVKLKNK